MAPTAPKPAPSGAVHEVGVDELFFSTTDSRGVIERSNDVFVRLSHYEREQLGGAPHNIIRHPVMPGGAFRAMWDTLEEGAPFAAYVRNLAANGSEYDVLATVTPLPGGGYLSVRTRPVVEELYGTATAVYADARALEDERLAAGATRRDAALDGAGRILELLAGEGIEDYENFQNTVLPAEVARREELSAGFPARPGASGPLASRLEAVTAVSRALETRMAQQDELAGLAHDLRRASRRLARSVEDPALTPEAVAALDRSDDRVAPLAQPLDLWLQMQSIVRANVTRLQGSLTDLERNVGRTRFRVALARLHATMTATFLVELLDGGADASPDEAREALEDVDLLTSALDDGVVRLGEQAREHTRIAALTATTIEETRRVLEIPRQLLSLWTAGGGSDVAGLPERAAALSRAAERTVSSTDELLERLGTLAEQCRSVDVASDEAGLRESLLALRGEPVTA
ncbi:PAS domain-containing protein [Actinomyces haliotis]|uniref:PAS domain-containing protein n=1 Tax=Actinomyces haliotis TaxID=1280843 RepID=UPI0018903FB2|nr:PAS domain-containing protein [Actinomyces haliotis]